MGQKVNPHGLRVGVIKDWSSRWYAKDEVFGDTIVSDYKLRKFLKERLMQAGVPEIEIERDSARLRVIIHCAKPGIVIGRQGSEIEKLKANIEKFTGMPCSVSVVEVKQPELNAKLVSENIAEQLEKVYFESGGGGNGYESYTAAWYMASRHTKLDCWERGQRGLIITLGDEPLNPILHKEDIKRHIGDNVAEDIHTKTLYDEVNKKYGVYHFSVDDSDTCYFNYKRRISDTWDRLLGDHSKVVTIDNLKNEIVTLIENFFSEDNVMDYTPIATEKVNNSTGLNLDEDGLVSW